jgi:Fe-S-cluster containining protein
MPSLDDTLRTLFTNETHHASAILSERRDQDTPVKLAFGAGQRAERTFLTVFQTVACKPGCGYCCYGTPVHVTVPEVLTIARGFKETLGPSGLAVVLDRVKTHAEAIRALTIAERHAARIPCALLDEESNLCTVHDARPMRCRAHHSLNLADCEAASLHPDEPHTITRYPDVIDAHEAMILGQKKALAAAKLDHRHFELTLALEVALEVDDAAERWARGERLFDAAVHTWSDEDPGTESDLPRLLVADAEPASSSRAGDR